MQTKTLLAAFKEQVERIETNWEARFTAERREHQERIETNWEARFNAERRERQERIETNWEARFNAERRERQEEMSALARSLAATQHRLLNLNEQVLCYARKGQRRISGKGKSASFKRIDARNYDDLTERHECVARCLQGIFCILLLSVLL
jgi:hypothetical protein